MTNVTITNIVNCNNLFFSAPNIYENNYFNGTYYSLILDNIYLENITSN